MTGTGNPQETKMLCSLCRKISQQLPRSLSNHSYSYIQGKILKQLQMNLQVRTLFGFTRKPKPKYSVVKPGSVSGLLHVPKHIVKPPYAQDPDDEKAYDSPKVIEIKNEVQIAGMRESCKLARKVLDLTAEIVKVGITTDEIDRFVHKTVIDHNAYPSTLLYRNFPKSVCTSINNVACHGIPDDRPLENSDIINIDITIFYNGFHGDLSETYVVGDTDSAAMDLIITTKKCRDEAINICKPGIPFSEIGQVIEDIAHGAGYQVVPYFCGHGIGEYFHGLPQVNHCSKYMSDDEGTAVMSPGMTFTIEPILTEGGEPYISICEDGWTAVMNDDSRTAHTKDVLVR
ncbi:unnamed protein product [Owenia fusiformis]|uniref:Methionine aminopeptidase n=1 Tax=Owenia fusiformis TaxID=6347 RepID=A0A8S4N2B8_OWEFU|nr:unnamed protein product [Owenia fusiformis]